MHKEDIILALEEKHKILIKWLKDQEDDKWVIAQRINGPQGNKHYIYCKVFLN